MTVPVSKKKQNLPDADPETPGSPHLRFRGEVFELTPSVDYPIVVLQTEEYETWIESISDFKTNARINTHVDRMQRGLLGDWKGIGDGLFEVRLDFGPGYRVYYARHGSFVVILLGGGDKSHQRQDITNARQLWEGLKNEITQV